jgi:hypothetical protein
MCFCHEVSGIEKMKAIDLPVIGIRSFGAKSQEGMLLMGAFSPEGTDAVRAHSKRISADMTLSGPGTEKSYGLITRVLQIHGKGHDLFQGDHIISLISEGNGTGDHIQVPKGGIV